MVVKLYKNRSKSRKLGKDLALVNTYECYMKDDTDTTDPTIIIEGITASHILDFNYMRLEYSEDLRKCYFITDVRMLRGRLLAITGHCDVLETYKEDLKENKILSVRSEKYQDKYLVDNSLPIDSDISIEAKKFGIAAFDKSCNHVILTTVGRGDGNE